MTVHLTVVSGIPGGNPSRPWVEQSSHHPKPRCAACLAATPWLWEFVRPGSHTTTTSADVRGRGLSWSRATKRFFLGVPLLPLSGLESCARLSHRKDPGSRGMSAWCSVRVARLAGARQWFGGSSLSVSGAKAGARSCTSLSGTATRTLQYDLCIIGGGSAGEHSGRSLQALALQVVELGLQFLHPPLPHRTVVVGI
jgi:hypothetical protein